MEVKSGENQQFFLKQFFCSLANWGFMGLAPAIGSFSATSLAGSLDDYFTAKGYISVANSEGMITKHCIGQYVAFKFSSFFFNFLFCCSQCFSYTLWICCGAVLLSFGVALWLRKRRNRFSKQRIYIKQID